MSKKNATTAQTMGIKLDTGDSIRIGTEEENANGFVARTGSERVMDSGEKVEDADGNVLPVYFIFPANKMSRALPEHGPFFGVSELSGRRFAYMTHSVPVKDKSGEWVPAVYTIHPEELAERTDEANVRRVALAQTFPGIAAKLAAMRSRR